MGKCRGVEGYECKASPPRYSQARKEEGGCLLLFGSCPRRSPEATLQGGLEMLLKSQDYKDTRNYSLLLEFLL